MANFTYTPINCSYYDLLESLAVKRERVDIDYRNPMGGPETTNAIIKDFRTENKEEFMILDNGTEIRLDRLVTVNGVDLNNYEVDAPGDN